MIKKHRSGNEYLLVDNVWVRNFDTENVAPMQLSHLFDREDFPLVLRNEELNKNYPKVSNEAIVFKKLVIVSDGYEFEKRHLFLKNLPKDVGILATNKSLRKWKLMNPTSPTSERKSINAFIVNNPYDECMKFMPSQDSKYYPTCLASLRTNCSYLKKYLGNVYTFTPARESNFGLDNKESYCIDDYRNPICAAIGLAYRFGVEKLMLVCCDDSFKEKRDAAVKLPNELWTHPEHLLSQRIIDANLYWLTHQLKRKVKAANYSNGIECANATYIQDEAEAIAFFMDDEEQNVKQEIVAT